MKIPKEIKIGGHIYQVIYPYVFKERFDRAGYVDSDKNKIFICQTMDNVQMPESRIEEIFLHEILHAIDHTYNGNKLEEDTVKRLAEGLYQVFKDNNLFTQIKCLEKKNKRKSQKKSR